MQNSSFNKINNYTMEFNSDLFANKDFEFIDSIPTVVEFNSIPWIEVLSLTYLIFLIGLSGMIYNRKNFLLTLLSIELMYLGITLSFIVIGSATADPKGQIYAIMILIIAAAESAVGLGLLIVLYRFGKSIDFTDYADLKG